MDRIYHHWEMWECYPAGFYDSRPPQGMDAEQAKDAYAAFLSELGRFDAGISRVFAEWRHSCEQFLTNPSINRIAWLGQAAMCIETGVSSRFRGGFRRLSTEAQRRANLLAQKRIQGWINERDASSTAVHSDLEAEGLFA